MSPPASGTERAEGGAQEGSATRLVGRLCRELGLPPDGVLQAVQGACLHPDPERLVARWCPHLVWALQARWGGSAVHQAQPHAAVEQQQGAEAQAQVQKGQRQQQLALVRSQQQPRQQRYTYQGPARPLTPLCLVELPGLFQDLYLHYSDRVGRWLGHSHSKAVCRKGPA